MKRATGSGSSTAASKRRKPAEPCDILLSLPIELFDIVMKHGGLSRKDLINASMLSSSHRARLFRYVFEEIKLTWGNFKQFDNTFKHKDLVKYIRVYSDLNQAEKTTYGEWNITLTDLLADCPALTGMTVEVMTSARCLKYQDKFDVDLSDKIKTLRLVSHATEAADESLFELTQLQRFHNVRTLCLNGFFLNVDKYFLPKFKPDLSDYKTRCQDGKLINLDQIQLVDCRWEHPNNLAEIFSPAYRTPNVVFNEPTRFTSPRKIGLYYSEESSPFVVSERFRTFLDNSADEQFLFQTMFYRNLTDLEIVVLNRNHKQGYNYYYPWMNSLNLKRPFPVLSEDTGEVHNQSILSNLESLTLVGWQLAHYRELDKLFDSDFKYNLKHLSLYLVGREDLDPVRDRLDKLLNAPGKNNYHCDIEVGHESDCLADGRYDRLYEKN